MQCPNCQFENMPGVKACGRCGASLQLGALAISVYPPRASAWVKWWRRWYGGARMAVHNAARAAVEQLIRRDAYDGPAGPLLRRTIVPGWPQFYQGQWLRGCGFLGVYMALAALALAMLGTDAGSICLGLALAAHASSVLDVVLPATRESDARMIRVLASLAVVGVIAYAAPVYVVSQFAAPQQITRTTGPLAAGDAVLVSTGVYLIRSPQPGDTVLYELPAVRVGGRSQGHAANYAFQGQRIDRIIAQAGQHVRVEGGKVLVDGQPSSQLPLDPSKVPPNLDVEVPAGCYLILPTTALMEGMDLKKLDWASASVVSGDRIIGRVWVRHWPWREFRFL